MDKVYEPLIIRNNIVCACITSGFFFFLKKKKKKRKFNLLGDQDLEISLMKDILDFCGTNFHEYGQK